MPSEIESRITVRLKQKYLTGDKWEELDLEYSALLVSEVLYQIGRGCVPTPATHSILT